MIKLIVGLGNYGEKYKLTRHNTGFWFLDKIAQRFNFDFKEEKKFKSLYGSFNFEGETIHCIKPLTYMNKSGEAVQKIGQFYKIDSTQILVAHDELDLVAGKIKLKKAGGLAGHNGLKSIVSQIGKDDFYRLRIGIGKPTFNVLNYVLDKPTKKEFEFIDDSLDQCFDFFHPMIELTDWNHAQNGINSMKPTES